jgi:hypothetical protein
MAGIKDSKSQSIRKNEGNSMVRNTDTGDIKMSNILQLRPHTRQEKNILVHNQRVRKEKIELTNRILLTENQLLIHKSAEDLLRN